MQIAKFKPCGEGFVACLYENGLLVWTSHEVYVTKADAIRAAWREKYKH